MSKRFYKCEETRQTVKGVTLKRCRKCLKWKEESEFRKDRARKDGLRIYCKACDRAQSRKRYRKNRKTVRGYVRYEDRHRVVRGVREKRCSHCQKWKYESEFYRDSRQKNGLSLQCKECERKRFERNRKTGRKYLRYESRHRVVNGVKQKFCRKCGKWKAESEYYKNSASKDGLSGWCKKCKLTSNRKRYRKAGKGLRKYYKYEECHRVVDGMKQKYCRKCKRWKAESEFYKNRWEKDGLTTRCKKCLYNAANKSRKKRRFAVRN